MSPVLLMASRVLKRGWVGLLSLLLFLLAFETVQPIVAESLGGAGGIEPLIATLPPAFQTMLKARPEFLAVSGLAGYLSIGFTHPLYIVLTSTAIITFATRSLAGEMERGTIQIALSRAISRPQVYASRVIGMILIVLVLGTLGPLGLWIGLNIAKPEDGIDYANFIPTYLATALLFWSVGGLSLLVSAISSTTARAVGIATAGMVVFYFVDYFANLWSVLKPFEPFSIFAYFDPAEAMVNGALPTANIVFLALVGAVGILLGLVLFAKRDLPS